MNEDSGLTSLGLGSVTYGPGGGSDEGSQSLTYEVTVIPDSNFFGKMYLADGTTEVTTDFYTLTEIQGMQFAPLADTSGGPSFFSYTVRDSGGTANGGANELGQSIQITVKPVNDNPVAIGESFTAVEGIPFTAELGLNDLLLNDTDIEGDTLSVNTTPVTGPANGSLVLNADGTFTYTPNNNFNGTDSFVYEVLDGNGGTRPGHRHISRCSRARSGSCSPPNPTSATARCRGSLPGTPVTYWVSAIRICPSNRSGRTAACCPIWISRHLRTATDMTINGLHFVSSDITVGGANSVDLQRGDLLFVSDADDTMTSNNSLAITGGDVIVFRPTAVDDYTSGTFIHLLDQPGTEKTTGITLIEKDVLIGDVTLQAGTFLFTQESVDRGKQHLSLLGGRCRGRHDDGHRIDADQQCGYRR